jgi:hypothetical protein
MPCCLDVEAVVHLHRLPVEESANVLAADRANTSAVKPSIDAFRVMGTATSKEQLFRHPSSMYRIGVGRFDQPR